MGLVRLTVVPTQMEAEMVCSLVQTAGIYCAQRRTDISAAVFGGTLATGGPFEILVPQAHLESARELLSREI